MMTGEHPPLAELCSELKVLALPVVLKSGRLINISDKHAAVNTAPKTM
jgi:hypothetical protein